MGSAVHSDCWESARLERQSIALAQRGACSTDDDPYILLAEYTWTPGSVVRTRAYRPLPAGRYDAILCAHIVTTPPPEPECDPLPGWLVPHVRPDGKLPKSSCALLSLASRCTPPTICMDPSSVLQAPRCAKGDGLALETSTFPTVRMNRASHPLCCGQARRCAPARSFISHGRCGVPGSTKRTPPLHLTKGSFTVDNEAAASHEAASRATTLVLPSAARGMPAGMRVVPSCD